MLRVKPITKRFARKLRSEMTDAEKLLWRRLRGKQIYGFKFRRQHPVGEYVLDFVCLEATLAVEVDGGQHSLRQTHDQERTAWLEKQGFRVLRFWNHEVLNNLDGVLETIGRALLEGALPPSRPSP